MQEKNNDQAVTFIVIVVICMILAGIVSLFDTDSSTTGGSGSNYSSTDYDSDYPYNRARQEGYSTSDSQKISEAIHKFERAQGRE